jgi:hypothetical protein
MMVKIEIPYKDEAQIYFQIKGEKSLIYAYKNNEGYYINLPKNKEVVVVMLSYDKNLGPLFVKENKNITRNETIELSPKPISLMEMKTALAAL